MTRNFWIPDHFNSGKLPNEWFQSGPDMKVLLYIIFNSITKTKYSTKADKKQFEPEKVDFLSG